MKNASTFSLIVLVVLGSLAWSIIVYMFTPADVRAHLLSGTVQELPTD